MSTIEADAKPILEPLLRAEGRQLDLEEQLILTRWALLKAIVFSEIHPAEVAVLREHRNTCSSTMSRRGPAFGSGWRRMSATK